MKPYSNPQIKKPKDDQWYIGFNYVVPEELRPYHKRGTERFKRYGDINMYHGVEREQNAIELCEDWKFALKNGLYNPFQDELDVLAYVELKEMQISMKETEIQEAATVELEKSEEDKRKEVSIYKAFELFLESRADRTDNTNTLSTYRSTVNWLSDYFQKQKRLMDPIGSVRHLEISGAVMQTKRSKEWENSTYNNEVTNAMTIFNWLAKEYYLVENPSKGRIDKLKTSKSKHKWYDRETAVILKQALLEQNCMPVYRACQFTYWICIRSKAELMKLKVGDIDRTLRRIRFSADLSKDNEEAFRDYPEEFEKILDEMELHTYPSHFYIFGKSGVPGETKCHKDFLADQFRPVRDGLKLSDRHTIYSWKHTRTIHEMMKKTDPYQIQHLLRHDNIKTTLDYMRDFEISLVNIYQAEDLTF